LTVEGGELCIALDESSLRAIAKVVNNKIAEQDEEKAEAVAEAAAELVEKDSEVE
jgi:ribosomal protein S20